VLQITVIVLQAYRHQACCLETKTALAALAVFSRNALYKSTFYLLTYLPGSSGLEIKTETLDFRSRDQGRDLGLQVLSPRPRPRPGQNELEWTESRDHGLKITTLVVITANTTTTATLQTFVKNAVSTTTTELGHRDSLSKHHCGAC